MLPLQVQYTGDTDQRSSLQHAVRVSIDTGATESCISEPFVQGDGPAASNKPGVLDMANDSTVIGHFKNFRLVAHSCPDLLDKLPTDTGLCRTCVYENAQCVLHCALTMADCEQGLWLQQTQLCDTNI